MAADNIYKLLEQLNDNIEDIRKYSSVITNDNKEQLITQLNNNISDIRKYSGYHPGENRNIISKMARRIKAKLSGQIKYDQAVERAIIDLFGLVSSQTMYNQSVERAIMDIYNIEARLHQYTVSMFEMLNDENYHKICDEKGPRIIQLVSTVNFGDAVGNDVNAIQNYLKKAGFTTATFAETIHPKIPEGTIMPFEIMPNLREDDILLYHFAAEDHFEEFIKEAPCKVVLRYHNVTPPKFFDGYDTQAKMNCQKGLDEIKALANYIDYGLVVSEFNKEDLISYGYTCPIDVAPILVQFDDYKQKPNQTVVEKYSDGKHNILFVGRMAPNKKVEDVISCFAEYKKNYDKDARLFLVGSFKEKDVYYNELLKHIKDLDVEDVVFPGHIGFDEILAYYTIADLFVCMSEHEGFCVPLVEAMFFDVPIVAFDSCAVPNTLGGSGCLVNEKNFALIAEKMNGILSDDDKRNGLVQGEQNRLRDFDNEVIGKQIVEYINGLM